MQGDPRVDKLMYPVELAIKRHVKDTASATDIYNRAYEALMNSMDVIDTSAKVTARQIAENAKNLQRVVELEAKNKRLSDALERFAKLDLTNPIGDAIAWDILNARAALKAGEE